MAIPNFLQSCFWSENLGSLDKKRDYKTVITQILNYGDSKQIKWLKRNYRLGQIKEVLFHPLRGIWFRERLRHWLGVFNLMIDPLEFEAAIRDLKPQRKLAEEVFRRKGLLP